ncbi:hypothetical protein [Novosphingobium guangzhouense]|uniref:hypothetical protein n=1 Tax=Novosphingobium guangzhouense TaxID=1850347 RepID=UPI001FE2EBFB|nr:hypothetical protein [Novosphingobium guangzhouense]
MDAQQLALHLGQFLRQALAVGRLARGIDDPGFDRIVVPAFPDVVFVGRFLDGRDVELVVQAWLSVMTDDDIGERPGLLLIGQNRRLIFDGAILRLEQFDTVRQVGLALSIGLVPCLVGRFDFNPELLETRLLFGGQLGRFALERAQIQVSL